MYLADLDRNYEKTFVKQVSKITNIPISNLDCELGEYVEISTEGYPHQHILSFELEEFPNCCGIGVLQGIDIQHKYKNKGLEKVIYDFALKQAKECRYGMVILANNVKADNIKALRGSGWTKLKPFTNPKTKNRLVAAYKTIGR